MRAATEYWDTRSNREAESSDDTGQIGTKRSIDISSSFDAPMADHSRPEAIEDQNAGSDFPVSEEQLMTLMKSAYAQGTEYQRQHLHPRWTAAYRAFNNQHATGSKYLSIQYRGRSRLYRPKTRSTARKKMAEAAGALFATNSAVTIKATDETDKRQKDGASLVSELLQYRLNRANGINGIPWFQIASGAHQCALLTGICVSKQTWEYREKTVFERRPFELAPGIALGEVEVPVKKVVRDRPRIHLFPPEDVIRDPAGAWEDQAQDSAYLILRYEMTVEDALTHMRNANPKSAIQYDETVTEGDLLSAAGVSANAQGDANVRRAREQNGNDRLADHVVQNAYRTVWLHENFLRIQGEDYVFWTLAEKRLISNVIPVEEAYPAQGGERPCTIGVGALEPFKIDPMSPVESWQPLQQEVNDVVNLRLDVMKQTISPLAKVRRGRQVDIKAIQNRSPDTVMFVQDMDDVEFDRPAGASGEAFVEMEKLNADFDDQAGNFSMGSVQTNRQLGETVGGMQMMNSNANALGEFDLRIWIETWVEPTLRQLVKLEQYYESDMNVVAISAKKAKVFDRPQFDQEVEQLVQSQVTLSVDVGLGAADPMMQLSKFEMATRLAGGIVGERLQQEAKRTEIIDEIFGKAGFKDAAERFFHSENLEEDPRLEQAQMMMQELQGALQEMQQQLDSKEAEIESRVQIAVLAALKDLAKQEMSQQAAVTSSFTNAAMQELSAEGDRNFQREQGAVTHARSMEAQDAKGQQAQQLQQARVAAAPAGKGPAGGKAPVQGEAPPVGPGGGSDVAQAVAPLAEAMMKGFAMLAQQIAGMQTQSQPQAPLPPAV